MSAAIHLALYQRMTVLYPKAFRDEYRADLSAVFAQQLEELGAPRCWIRTVRDLIVSIPAQHMEPRMKNPVSSYAFILCLALAISGTVMAVVIGASLYAIVFAIVAVASLGSAIALRRAAKPVVELERASSWKKFVVGGGLMLGALIVLMNLPANRDQDLSPVEWSGLMLSLLVSLSLIGAGVVLGAMNISRNRHR